MKERRGGGRKKEEGGRKTADFCKILDLKCYILILLKEAAKPNSVSRNSHPEGFLQVPHVASALTRHLLISQGLPAQPLYT